MQGQADETLARLADQVGFYFSDSNLRKDRFLLTRTGADGTGSVELATLLTFKKVQALTRDVGVLRSALSSLSELQVSDDGATVRRIRALPSVDDSDERTVYVEPLQTSTTHEAVQRVFSPHGAVAHVSLPRYPMGGAKGFAFVEFSLAEEACAAVSALDGSAAGEAVQAILQRGRQSGEGDGVGTSTGGGSGLDGGDGDGEYCVGSRSADASESAGAARASAGALRVMHKRAWLASKAEYKAALARGMAAAAAEAAARKAAATAGAEFAAATAAEPERRLIVKLMELPKTAPIKATRKEMRAGLERIAPVDFVDYGISESGNPTVAYVRMTSAVGAAEAVRVVGIEGLTLAGVPVRAELMRGDALWEYTERIAELRDRTAASRAVKRDKWWAKKWGANGDPAASGGSDGQQGAGDGEGGVGDATGRAEAGGGAAGEGATGACANHDSAVRGAAYGGARPAEPADATAQPQGQSTARVRTAARDGAAHDDTPKRASDADGAPSEQEVEAAQPASKRARVV